MSRHRKVKAMDLDEEYDDYYGDFDDDDDNFEDGDFESKYLSSGIDLHISESNNPSKLSERPHTIDLDENLSSAPCKTMISEDKSSESPNLELTTDEEASNLQDNDKRGAVQREKDDNTTPSHNRISLNQTMTSDLTKMAIQHLDQHQWRLPLLEMDSKFRDRTYYKHYTDNYISSLRSKLGHFLADHQLLTNPMRYHAQRDLDNYLKYSKMFGLLTEYYQSLGANFFSFATPSPDEEIVIGCRLGTKVKKPVQKGATPVSDELKTARFEYTGKKQNATKQSKSDSRPISQTKLTKHLTKSNENDAQSLSNSTRAKDLIIREDFTAEQLDKLARNQRELDKKQDSAFKDKTKVPTLTKAKTNVSQVIDTKPSTSGPSAKQKSVSLEVNSGVSKPHLKQVTSSKPLATLTEKRQNLKDRLKQGSEPSAQDWEMFKLKAIQTTKEYNELVKGSRVQLNLVVVGHVDAGKSTLVGHLLYKLGQVSNKQMHRNEVDSQRSGKASFKFAWALDETNEERARGVTIDIALTKFQTNQRDVILLDAPGHVDFIPAVITGAAQADAALLVVDATRGEFETGFEAGGQTREHTFLVRSLGVKSLIVVVNKMDNVNWNWSRFLDIVDQVKPFLRQVGFNLKEDVQFVAVSGLTGDNLTERRQDVLRRQSSHPQLESVSLGAHLPTELSESSQPSLLEAIDRMRAPDRMVDKPTRVTVTDVFKGMSGGVFLGAKVVSGKIEPKQRMLLLPPNELCDIKQVEVRDTKSTQGAFAGDIITTVTSGIDMQKYHRGCILCDPVIPCSVTNRFQARIIMFQNASTILIKGTPIEVHINGSYESGEVRKLISLLNKSSGELIQKRPRCVAQNASAIIQLKLARVVCCELYENNKDLGRFMMRSYGKTIAAGLITKIKTPKVSKSGSSKMKSK